ncbi:hypothetical protein THIAE_04555 [Thiomicrospira aerophila AL3]|uniref:Uncharacterized protein n=1 Tax=Thiomicrospira aerophila AL3 TaxID=717772 RepID=W0DZ37_9GAMM|nr:hypothetical protein THIAE_04555 [Thiomicrospira aerophila AL3]
MGQVQKIFARALKTFVCLKSENIAKFAFTTHNNEQLCPSVTRFDSSFFS